MTTEVKFRRGTTAEMDAFTGAAGELAVDTDKNVAVIHDGSTAGGLPGMPATPAFTSSEQAVTVNSVTDVAHGLAALPRLVIVSLRCKTAELGFSIGDEIPFNVAMASGADQGVTVCVDATNVSIIDVANVSLMSKSPIQESTITVANWKWIVRAWL